MQFTVIPAIALVALASGWVFAARRGSPYLGPATTAALAGWVGFGVVSAVRGEWVGLGVSALAVVVFALLRVASRMLGANRYPSPTARAALGELGERAVGGEGSPLVGEVWQVGSELFLVATTRDEDRELEMWVRAAQVALRTAPEGTRLLMVAEGARTRTETVAGAEVQLAAPGELRRVLGPSLGNRGSRRRKR